MVPNKKKFKLIKLGKSKKIWSSDPEETYNPFITKGTKEQQYVTVCYQIPLAAQYVETIFRDGQAVWERSQGSTYNSAILGGGGRFIWRRKWYNRKIVAIELEFKDVPLGQKDHDWQVLVRI